MKVQFLVDVGGIDGLDGDAMRLLKRAIVEQAERQDINATCQSREWELQITLEGQDGFVQAYEAAIRSWASQRQ